MRPGDVLYREGDEGCDFFVVLESKMALLSQLSIAPEETPVVIWRGQQVRRNPTNAELARAIGLPAPGMDRFDLVIVGAGPAGLAAAVYGASEG